MRDFRKLIAWQKAHALVVAVHRDEEVLGLRSAPGLRGQMLRAASSTSANIAEGAGKRSGAEFARYLDIALGSARELDNHLLLARDVGAANPEVVERLIADNDEVKRIVFSLARAVRTREGGGSG